MDKSLSTISIEQRLCRIRGEYLEMPGLRLTSAQAQRLLQSGHAQFVTRQATCKGDFMYMGRDIM